MALKQYWTGSAGPYLYDDTDFEGFRTDTQMRVDQQPSKAYHVLRLGDLGGNFSNASSNTTLLNALAEAIFFNSAIGLEVLRLLALIAFTLESNGIELPSLNSNELDELVEEYFLKRSY